MVVSVGGVEVRGTLADCSAEKNNLRLIKSYITLKSCNGDFQIF